MAVTRAIGDSQLFPFVSPEPYISVTELRDDDEFIVIACDGLFDVFPDDVVGLYFSFFSCCFPSISLSLLA